MTGEPLPFDNDLTAEIERLRFALQAATIGTWDYDLLSGQAQWSAICKELFGLPADAEVTAPILLEQVHSDDRERVRLANMQVLSPESDGRHNIRFRTLNLQGTLRWVEAKGKVLRDSAGEVVRFSGIVQDVTQRVLDRQKLTASQAQLTSVVQQTPAATMVLLGDNYRIEHINPAMLAFFGQSEEVIGQSLLAVMPELEGQFAWQQAQRVYDEGISFDQEGVMVPHNRSGVVEVYYYNVSYRPLLEDGQIIGMIQVVTDVTGQVKTQQALKASQTLLQSIVELAELGSYSIDVTTNRMTKSPRVADWYGLPEHTDVTTSIGAVLESDRERISQVLASAMAPGSDGAYQVEYTVVNQRTGYRRILRTNGQVRRDSVGQPICIDGSVLDITSQREQQLALEALVQQRTEELAAVNEELAATNEELLGQNEEYADVNDRLEEANADLRRSNQNLEQFAYIASHDLQEPLRKIQQFGDLLTTHYGTLLGDGLDYLQRMQSAASRMSTLVRDLLTYSRIATQRESNEPVSLTTVVQTVLTDLDLRVEETGATLDVEPLPTVIGDASQLTQLFHNLLSNALKFGRRDAAGGLIPPLVRVKAALVRFRDLPSSVKPTRSVEVYHRIDVVDNGIGFDTKYLDRIFQVFQRLHGKSEFAGTGIGLAICEKVAANHGGAITASSQPGQGATFCVYLPA